MRSLSVQKAKARRALFRKRLALGDIVDDLGLGELQENDLKQVLMDARTRYLETSSKGHAFGTQDTPSRP